MLTKKPHTTRTSPGSATVNLLTPQEESDLANTAREIRCLILKEIASLGVGHVGGSLSMVDALTAIYSRHLRASSADPTNATRDRFVLSKGHAGPGLYATLAYFGYFPTEELLTLNRPGTSLPSHPDMTKTPGVDMTTGSLAQGFSAAVGIAEGQRLVGSDARTYAIVGDGETQEGQIWEAALLAAQLKLGNLIALTDYNSMCLDGYLNEINDVAPLDKKWEAFRWHTQVIDGHDLKAIDTALQVAENVSDQPSMIILKTTKGKGVTEIENAGPANHSMNVNPDLLASALKELEEKEKSHV